jgi:spore germination protein KA
MHNNANGGKCYYNHYEEYGKLTNSSTLGATMNLFRKLLRHVLQSKQQMITQPQPVQQECERLTGNLNMNVQKLRSIYENCPDAIFRPFLIGGKIKAMLIYIAGLSNVESMDNSLLFPLMQRDVAISDNIGLFIEQNLTISKVQKVDLFDQCIERLSIGDPLIIIDQELQGIALGLAKWDKRAVEEPSAESVVRGPREGFVESIAVNMSLLRRKIRSPQLKMQSMHIGRYTMTEVVIAYIDGLTDHTLIEEVRNRLMRIDLDGILESSYIEELIEDESYSVFPQILDTERPDVVAASLLEGRVAIFVDGTPFVLVAPMTMYSMMQSAEDYYQRFLFSSAIRWLRYGALVISLLLPSLYVAVMSFHQEMIPSTLFISIAKSREEVPFPVLVEAFIMEITFEALREAGVRLPKQIGAAVSIVGALVIGQAAVSAGIVSAPMVMIVSITGIASFMIPRYSTGIAIRLLRFPIMLSAGILGLVGVMLAVIVVIIHLCTLRSFGVPYLSPMGPMKGRDMKDVLFRAPWWSLNTRPHLTGNYDEYRQSRGQKPDPTKGTE